MKALLLIAHGSRRKESNDEVSLLAEKLKVHCNNQYQVFKVGFLEIATPSIDDGIKNCIKAGATSIVILPYFLNSGRHVINDIPEIVKQTKAQFPEIKMDVTPHIGSSELMMTILIDAANATQ